MNLNLLAYSIYALFMSVVIVRVGLLCYRHGQTYINNILPHNLDLSIYINKVLLTGYYLVNLGYSIYMISTWKSITTIQEVMAEIAGHSGEIILLLAILHYINMLGIHLLFNKQPSLSNL